MHEHCPSGNIEDSLPKIQTEYQEWFLGFKEIVNILWPVSARFLIVYQLFQVAPGSGINCCRMSLGGLGRLARESASPNHPSEDKFV